MDGVIINNDRFHYLAWLKFARQHGKSLSFEEVKSWFGSTNESILINFFNRQLTEHEIKEFANQKEEMYRELYSPHIEPIEGLKELLDAASADGYKIGLATSAPPGNVDFVLEKTRLGDYFQVITDETQISNGKPDPEIFILTAHKLNVNSSRSIVFEDSFYGIEAAKKAGMKVIAVASTHHSDRLQHADRVILNFTELDIQELDGLIE